MRITRLIRHAVILAALTGLHPTGALAGPIDRAAALSKTLGGPIGDGMGAAGDMGHGSLGTAPELRSGRGDAYRRQVARRLKLDKPSDVPELAREDLVARSGTRSNYASSSSSDGARRL